MWLGRILPHIHDAYRSDKETFRTHLGASIIGRDCAREIWYSFRWAAEKQFEGRMIRLFNRGHLEEGRFIALLTAIGVQLHQQDTDGKQFRISDCDGHFGGSCDGIAQGIPDLPGQWAIVEMKTHKADSFKKLQTEGMKNSKPEHYVQMQIYMHKFKIPAGLYLAVNKDNDDLYAEVVYLDEDTAIKYLERAGRIIQSEQPPARINESPGYWKCRFCDYHKICHRDSAPDKNCRTCMFSKPAENGSWVCGRWGCAIDKERQLAGCEEYERGF